MNSKATLFNFRAFLPVAVSIFTAIFLALLSSHILWLGWLGMGILVLIFAVISIKYYAAKQALFKQLTLLIAVICSIFAFLGFTVRYNTWLNTEIAEGSSYRISATVDNVSVNTNTFEYRIVIKNATADDYNIQGKIIVYADMSENALSALAFAREGDKIELTATIYFYNLIDGANVDGAAAVSNIRYRAYTNTKNIQLIPGEPNPIAAFAIHLKEILYGGMGKEYGSLAYAILTGGKDDIGSDVREAFTVSGLSHALAVSGLNMVFLYGIITAITKLFKLKKVPEFFIVSAFLIFYLFLSSLSPSAVRAVIMCEAAMLARLFFARYDPLSSLGFSCSAILLFNPFYLFDVGFVLSASAVFGLILFSPTLERFFRFLRLPKAIRSPLTATLSAQIGIMPAVLYYFSSVQLYSLLTNLLLLFVMSVIFVVMFFLIVLCLIWQGFMPLLSIVGIGLSFVYTVAGLISHLPFAEIFVLGTVLGFLCYPLFFITSRFFMPRKKALALRIPCIMLCLILCAVGPLLSASFNSRIPANAVIPVKSYGEVTSVVSINKRSYIIGDLQNGAAVINTLKFNGIQSPAVIILTSANSAAADSLAMLSAKYSNITIFCPIFSGAGSFGELAFDENLTFRFIVQDRIIDSLFEPLYSGETFLGILMQHENLSALFIGKEQGYLNVDLSILNKVSLIRAHKYEGGYEDRIFLSSVPYTFFPIDLPPNFHSASNHDALILDLETGKLFVRKY